MCVRVRVCVCGGGGTVEVRIASHWADDDTPLTAGRKPAEADSRNNTLSGYN